MKWRIVVLLPVVVLAPALGACQVTPEFLRAALCEPVEPPPVVELPPEVLGEPSGW